MKLTANIVRSSMLALALAGGAVATTGCANTGEHRTAGEYLDDATISTKVKAAFVEDKTVGALRINVETHEGVVQLSGFANSQDEINRAAELAKQVKGVKSVKNDIRLK